VWTGYIENLQFTSGSDDVRVEIDAAGAGSVRFGDAPDLPAPDPAHTYPAGLDWGGPPGGLPYEGFDYAITSATVSADRLVFSVDPNELWGEWCALQTPIASVGAEPAFFSCAPNSYTTTPDGGCETGGVPIDCGKLVLCNPRVCACTESACTVAAGDPVTFDVLVTAEGGHGSVTGLSRTNVYSVWLQPE
jgi:hypothetical protein